MIVYLNFFYINKQIDNIYINNISKNIHKFMIKDKFIKIKIKNRKQLESLDNEKYNIGDEIFIPTNKLSKGSHQKIDVICTNCKDEKTIQFNVYHRITKELKDDYYCNNKECINKKRKLSLISKYGVENVFELEDIKNKIKKTNIEKYGVENPQQNKTIKEKTIKTIFLKYGVKNVFQNENIKNKSKETMLKKYGVEYPQQSDIIRSKYPSLHKPSKIENDLLCFIKENYTGDILTNKNNIIKGYELDIYLPDLNLAFEFNGLYWHSEIYKDYKYHYNKSDLCVKEKIQLIHIWEDDWEYKENIIKSIILNKLGKTKNKLYARKTIVKELKNNNLIKNFLNKNHIQGFVGSSIKLGLFYENELVSLMSFGKKRKNLNSKSSDREYEMLRFCNKLNTSVIGGASKLFKYFIKTYNPKQVISYADRSYSNGNIYRQLGFNLSHISRPNYYYIIGRKRKYRFGFRKDVLVNQGFDSNKTEHQIMLERKIYRIYNSGNLVFKFNQ